MSFKKFLKFFTPAHRFSHNPALPAVRDWHFMLVIFLLLIGGVVTAHYIIYSKLVNAIPEVNPVVNTPTIKTELLTQIAKEQRERKDRHTQLLGAE